MQRNHPSQSVSLLIGNAGASYRDSHWHYVQTTARSGGTESDCQTVKLLLRSGASQNWSLWLRTAGEQRGACHSMQTLPRLLVSWCHSEMLQLDRLVYFGGLQQLNTGCSACAA